MISQGFELPWDHRNASVLPLKLGTFFLNIKSGSCKNAYMLLEFQRINKQMATKPIVDYFQRVCDATIIHVSLTWHITDAAILRDSQYICNRLIFGYLAAHYILGQIALQS